MDKDSFTKFKKCFIIIDDQTGNTIPFSVAVQMSHVLGSHAAELCHLSIIYKLMTLAIGSTLFCWMKTLHAHVHSYQCWLVTSSVYLCASRPRSLSKFHVTQEIMLICVKLRTIFIFRSECAFRYRTYWFYTVQLRRQYTFGLLPRIPWGPQTFAFSIFRAIHSVMESGFIIMNSFWFLCGG